MNRSGLARIIFVTGSDTGVGKTLLTGLLLHHLRRRGCHALAVKPFCSGSRTDAEFLGALQDGELAADKIAPFFFSAPLAPLAAARRRRIIRMAEVRRHLKRMACRCECLLIEGIGGLLVPLGKGFTVRDLIVAIGSEVIVVSRNRLGTLNHTLLTGAALQQVGIKDFTTVLMTVPPGDASSVTNRLILAEMLAPNPVFELGFLGRNPVRPGAVKLAAKKVEKTLARILGCARMGAPGSL